MAGIFIFSCVQWSGISYGKYQYPAWAEFCGWLVALSSMLFIPGVAIYQLMYNSTGTLMEVIIYQALGSHRGKISASHYPKVPGSIPGLLEG